MGWDVDETTDSGYIVVGETYSFSFDKQGYLVKTDAKGDTVWTNTYGGPELEQLVSVEQTSDRGYIASGTTTDGSIVQGYLIKTRPDGSPQWFGSYGGWDWENLVSVQQTTDGGYISAGWTFTYGAGASDIYLVKTDSLGNEQWSRTYGGRREELGKCVQQTSDGGYIVVGHTESFGPMAFNVYLIKTNSEGDTLWTRTYAPPFWSLNAGLSCQQTTDGGYIISGLSHNRMTSIDKVYLIKTDAEGDTLWTRLYGERTASAGNSVCQTSDGGYIVVGYTHTVGSIYENDIYLIKTNPDGDTLWTRTYGDIGGDIGRAVIQATDGNYVVAGGTRPCGAVSDMFLLQISSSPLGILRGDVTGESLVDVVDVAYIIEYLYRDGPPPEQAPAGDVNCQGRVDLEDVVYLIRYVYKGGPEPECRCL